MLTSILTRSTTLAATLTLASSAAFAQTSVGVSIGINQPGVYGRVDIGTQPPPVVYAQPVIAVPVPVHVRPEPALYLYVPPGHEKNWRKHCARYDACGRPVYFVQERWVRERYEDSRRHEHGDRGGKKPKKDKHGHDD